MEIVLLGHMGRDEAAAERLLSHKLHVLGQWENPGLQRKAEATGGRLQVIDSITDVEAVADYVQAVEPDMFFTNFDDSLAAGVVDAIRRRVADKRMPEVLLPCPDREASKVEWDKFYLRELIEEIDPSYNPQNSMVESVVEADDAIASFKDMGVEIVIKPRNLTGGKGVKVQGKHFDTYEEGREYAHQVLAAADQQGIEVQEKLDGHEFTLQLFTDGTTVIRPSMTYDYPYREDGDTGPGTGGMGTFSMKPGEHLPFADQDDYDQAVGLMERLLRAMKERGSEYKGVLYPTFFKTRDGLKIVEVNARGGDPELVNILDLMDESVYFGEVLKDIANGELSPQSVRFKNAASAMLYLVSPDYGYRKGPAYDFRLDDLTIEELGCKVRFAAAERAGVTTYRTVGSPRTIGLSALGATPWEAREKIHAAIQDGFRQPLSLQYRQEIADQEYIRNLS